MRCFPLAAVTLQHEVPWTRLRSPKLHSRSKRVPNRPPGNSMGADLGDNATSGPEVNWEDSQEPRARAEAVSRTRLIPSCKLARSRRQFCVQITDPLDALSVCGANYLDPSGEQQ
jgi:hypothetical protein